MISCTCDFGTICGPAMMAAGFLRRIEEREAGKKRRSEDGTTRNVLDILACRLQGGGPVLFEFAHWADELDVPVARLREVVAWLVENQFLALEGDVDGVARLWVNPSVAFTPWSDPRLAAARYRFPYITTAEEGMAAERPVIVRPTTPTGGTRSTGRTCT
ncbi:hypothetical protein NRK68_34375 (plasmid) [Streptomyces yangpuensis]|uniref:Uncharacterized protein n=1 Tax=Streptomyces yangpuensis TaxID=1648182 RepID=A0ABY5Q863_9ACTN|nr:hypothetical protein [Streptomyces yangpuensis]UUY52360.1 hypothetical protein NRK68_34375 [Streptomyces yangpuensis]